MSRLIVTVDLDWASEAAIEETLAFLKAKKVDTTVFITHRSPAVEACMNELDVALHPFFGPDSSHGNSISEVVHYVMNLPHNFPAFRCHRFGVCNASRQAMVEAGMLLSSNVCTDLEIVPPFRDRFGLLEVPIFLEDGGYLWRKRPLEMNPDLLTPLLGKGDKVLLIHPMHFSLNTPHFEYMSQLKKSFSRKEWNQMTDATLNRFRWKKRGIRDLLEEVLQVTPQFCSLKSLLGGVI